MNRIYVQNNCTYEALASYHTLLKIHIFHKKASFASNAAPYTSIFIIIHQPGLFSRKRRGYFAVLT